MESSLVFLTKERLGNAHSPAAQSGNVGEKVPPQCAFQLHYETDAFLLLCSVQGWQQFSGVQGRADITSCGHWQHLWHTSNGQCSPVS